MSAKRIAVLGLGQLGLSLSCAIWPKGWSVKFYDRKSANSIDMEKPYKTAQVLRDDGPWDAIINACAYTGVDRAEMNKETCYAVNVDTPLQIARVCKDSAFVFISSDFVFDGHKKAPYLETDRVNPLGIYGRSKEQGELHIRVANKKHLIIRTSWLFSEFGNNILSRFLQRATDHQFVNGVKDNLSSPTSSHELARAIILLLSMTFDGKAEWGTYHVASGEYMSSYDFFSKALEYSGIKTPLKAVGFDDYLARAKRPQDSRLSIVKAQNAGFQHRNLDDCILEATQSLLKMRKTYAEAKNED